MMRGKVLLVTLALVATAAFAQTWTVDPGRGVGPLALNMSPSQVAGQLAATEYVGSQQTPMFVKYGTDALVQYSSNKAVLITLNNNTVKTKAGAVKWTPYGGAAIGVAWNVVEGTLGRNYVSRDLKVGSKQPREVYYAYSSKGLGFRTRAGVIVQVDVFPAR